MAEVWSPHAILIEDKASGQSLTQDGREEGLPVIAIEPEASKIIRMPNQSPLVEAGLIMFPEKAHWLYDFEQEVIHFTKSKHDAQVGTLSQLLKWQRT
jgi:predicted phage terminase large subunit-like protein